ncbi:16S rRNA (uracil(1498)-N(3))-methyltransferase [Mycoplasmopsis alligatoris]|uniref:Ribosomal RNA small subunit methyltransferase E n=1 Tax=Mycoplasmopsis alligatoris A21JP2 TaxID=747682 RepID=D4XUX5_9BACT|nr:16S rRNA (uracil(1498)-N(3))-methyltransferase [Mycoplasmopsis alligatoris]EFF41836.1 RNA methyltransferase, RsmE family [Mycoplasmopsis alligatoris A21JP2]
MNRFFATSQINENYFELDKETLKHLAVIRIEQKPFIINYLEKFYLCRLENNLAKIIEPLDINNELGYEVILAASIIKIERYEWLIQKAIELGATKIVPIISKHTDGSIYKHDKFAKKYDRFNTIIKSATEQSFRNKLITLDPIMDYKKAIYKYKYINNKYIAHEIDLQKTSKLDKIKSDVIFFVGPEGGYDQSEIDYALENNYKCIYLGKRILRAETASIYLLSQLDENN